MLPEIVRRHGLHGGALLVADPITYEVCGRQVAAHLEGVCPVRTAVLGGPDGLEANEETVRAPLEYLSDDTGFMIAVGAGTVNDIVKYAATQAGVPYLAVPTAPSMNGYTSLVVALMSGGLKATAPGNPPVAVVGDLEVLCAAPDPMIKAGLGDIIAKWTSNADWYLGHRVKGDYFCALPTSIIRDLEAKYCREPERLAAADPTAVAALAEALMYSGISMVVAGTSSPASGAEHLISHTLDMRASLVGRRHELHGAQVGVATIFVAALYEEVCRWDPARLDLAALRKGYPALEAHAEVARAFFGSLTDAVMGQFEQKQMPWHEKQIELEALAARWREMISGIRPYLKPAHQIRSILQRAGAPATAAQLGLGAEEFLATVRHARMIRSRYTVLDLAQDLGLLPEVLEEVAHTSGVV